MEIPRLSSCLCAAFFLATMPAAPAATLTVTTTNDTGSGCLRQAILTAGTGDTINFAVTGAITLTNGELLITNNLNIVGPGATNLGVSGNFSGRILEIASNITVNISGLTLR